jgi:hypothetical protein
MAPELIDAASDVVFGRVEAIQELGQQTVLAPDQRIPVTLIKAELNIRSRLRGSIQPGHLTVMQFTRRIGKMSHGGGALGDVGWTGRRKRGGTGISITML